MAAATQVLLLCLLHQKQEGLKSARKQNIRVAATAGVQNTSATRVHHLPPLPDVDLKVTASKVGTWRGCLGSSRRLLDLQEVGALKGPQGK